VWIDFLSREMIHGGGLRALIEDDAVVGATSNPTIFQKAMSAGNGEYDEQLRELEAAGQLGRSGPVEAGAVGDGAVERAFWALAERDVADACDVFRPTFDGGLGRDGYVSIEVDPRLAYDTLATFNEAMRLHEAIDRPNLLVKIPATKPGLAAIEDATAKGRSINITLIFSLRRYEEVAESYIRGLERLVAEGGDPRAVTSVASFFVSRIDTEADRRLDELSAAGGGSAGGDGADGGADGGDPAGGGGSAGAGALDALKGKLAVANAKLAYSRYQHIFQGPRWEYLAGKGAKPQRVLWASTSTKNPAYPDTLYVDELIGPDTINTMPQETIQAFQDHGKPRSTLTDGLTEAHAVFEKLAAAGVDYDDVTDTLEREGVEKFEASFAELLASLEAKLGALAAA
jgi:transaldolase